MPNRKDSVYFTAEFRNRCNYTNCSRHRVIPFRIAQLVRIKPAPDPQDQERAEFEARVAFESFKYDIFRTLRDLSQAGNLAGVILRQLFHGTGGDEVCKMFSEECECSPDMTKPYEIWHSPPIYVPIKFYYGTIEMEATFEVIMEWRIVNAYCINLQEPI